MLSLVIIKDELTILTMAVLIDLSILTFTNKLTYIVGCRNASHSKISYNPPTQQDKPIMITQELRKQ